MLRKSTFPARAPEAGCALHVFFVSAKVVAQKLDLGSRQHVQRQHLPGKKYVFSQLLSRPEAGRIPVPRPLPYVPTVVPTVVPDIYPEAAIERQRHGLKSQDQNLVPKSVALS